MGKYQIGAIIPKHVSQGQLVDAKGNTKVIIENPEERNKKYGFIEVKVFNGELKKNTEKGKEGAERE